MLEQKRLELSFKWISLHDVTIEKAIDIYAPEYVKE